MKINLALLFAILAISGCGSFRQNVSPVAKFEGKQICILENTRVRASFLAAYKKALEEKGYDARVPSETAQLSTCPITSKYVALWGWDLVPYMSHAEILVYNKAQPAGRAVYNGNKFIGEEEKIKELVNQLFPG